MLNVGMAANRAGQVAEHQPHHQCQLASVAHVLHDQLDDAFAARDKSGLPGWWSQVKPTKVRSARSGSMLFSLSSTSMRQLREWAPCSTRMYSPSLLLK